MPPRLPPKSFLRGLDLSEKDILSLDSKLFSAEEKKSYIDLLYGTPDEGSWKYDLESVANNLRRWKLLLGGGPIPGTPYRVAHEELLLLAKNYPPKEAGQTVTDFTDWMFRLYVPERNYSSLLRGQQIERKIASLRVPAPVHSRWNLEFNGMCGEESKAFEISELKINGAPLRGKPDLVFREKGTKRILIIEVKTSDADIPSDGWPNMRAQLWAYSKVDAWRDAEEMLLVGEVWGLKNGLRLRKSIRWIKGDQMLERENAELFAYYRNHCESIGRARDTSGA